MICFDREELYGHLGGLLGIVVPWVAACLVVLGWSLHALAAGLARRVVPGSCRRPCCRSRRRRRRPPLHVLAHPAHNPDLDGVVSPPPPTREET